MKIRNIAIIVIALLTLSGNANAWWNKDWDYRKEFNLDTTATGLPLEATMNERLYVNLYIRRAARPPATPS